MAQAPVRKGGVNAGRKRTDKTMVLNYENGNYDEVAHGDGEFEFCLPFRVCLFICQFIVKVSSS